MGDTGDVPAKRVEQPDKAEDTAQAGTEQSKVVGHDKQSLKDTRDAVSANASHAEASTQRHIQPVDLRDDTILLVSARTDDELMIPVEGTDAAVRWSGGFADIDKDTCQRLTPKVDSLIKALTPHNGYDAQTNRETVFSVLKDMSESDRKLVGLLYQDKRRHPDLEGDSGIKADLKIADLTRGDRDRITSLLRFGKDDDASRLHADLVDMSQKLTGPDLKSSERDIRDTLSTINSQDLGKLETEYKSRYGEDLKQVLRSNANISAGTRYFLDIAFRGSDKRTDDDRRNIADIAVENKDIELFKEAMRGSSQTFRDKFLADAGLEKIKAFEGKDYEQAKEYAQLGVIGTASTIRDNTWLDERLAMGIPSGIVNLLGMGNNKQAIETQLSNLTNEERNLYLEGRGLALGIARDRIPKSIDSAKAIKCYNEIQSALSKAGNEEDLTRWEKIISGRTILETETIPNPEAKLHDFIQGKGPSRDEMELIVNSLSVEDREKLKSDYRDKYGSDVIGDLALSRESKANRSLRDILERTPTDSREAFHRQQDQMLTGYDGIGKHLTNAFSATGRQADNAYQEFAEALAKSSSASKSIPAEELQRLTNKCSESIKTFREAKHATAQGLADVAITAGTLALAVPSGGTSLSLLGFTTGAGATAKVAIKSAIEGNDYDRSKLASDAISGGLDAATATIAPEHIAKVMSLGSRAASTITKSAVAGIAPEALKSSAAEVLKKDLSSMISQAIGNQTMQISDHQLAALAKKIASEGSEHEVEQVLKASVQAGIASECKNELAKTMTRYGLNSGAGAAGGAISGAYYASSEVDPRASASEQISQVARGALASAALGGLTGAAFTAGTETLRGTVSKVGEIKRALSERRLARYKASEAPAHFEHGDVESASVSPAMWSKSAPDEVPKVQAKEIPREGVLSLTENPARQIELHDIEGNLLLSGHHSSMAEAVQFALDNGTSLRGANLRGADLRGVNWRYADLTDADFAGANLEDATFELAKSIEGANFADSKLRGAVFEEQSIRSVNFSGANLRETNFTGATADSTTDFSNADLSDAIIYLLHNFEQAKLRGAILQGQDLTCFELAGVDLEGAHLEGASMSGMDLSGTNLRNCKAQSIWLEGSDLSKAIIDGADLSHAKLSLANLSEQDLTQVRLDDAYVSDAILARVKLSGIDLKSRRISIKNSDLSGADLRGTVLYDVYANNFSGADLRNATFVDGPFAGPDTNFSKADLRGTNLSSIDFVSRANLEQANLTDLDLRRLCLYNARLAGACLEGANLDRASLNGANLKGANLKNAIVTDAVLRNADLEGQPDLGEPDEWGRSTGERRSTNLEGADFTKSDLSGANLEGHSFSGTKFLRANLSNAKLRYGDFTNANLEEAKLQGSDLKGADLEDVDLSEMNLRDVDFSEANLAMSNLSGSYLNRSHLIDADLRDANMQRADLSNAYLAGADCSNSDLRKVKLINTDITDVKFKDAKKDFSLLEEKPIAPKTRRRSKTD